MVHLCQCAGDARPDKYELVVKALEPGARRLDRCRRRGRLHLCQLLLEARTAPSPQSPAEPVGEPQLPKAAPAVRVIHPLAVGRAHWTIGSCADA